jgi:hypothetical protein
MTTSPRLGFTDLEEGETVPEVVVNETARILEQSSNSFIVEQFLTTPPGSPTDGISYIIAATATGAWTGKENQIALRIGSSWHYVTPIKGTRAYNQNNNLWYIYIASASQWRAGDQSLIVACSDETTDLTTGDAKVTFRMPYSFGLAAVRASVTTAPTGAAISVDLIQDGVSFLSTPLTIDAGEKTSTTAATPAVISDTTLADDSEITVNLDQIGSTIPGMGLKIALIGSRL